MAKADLPLPIAGCAMDDGHLGFDVTRGGIHVLKPEYPDLRAPESIGGLHVLMLVGVGRHIVPLLDAIGRSVASSPNRVAVKPPTPSRTPAAKSDHVTRRSLDVTDRANRVLSGAVEPQAQSTAEAPKVVRPKRQYHRRPIIEFPEPLWTEWDDVDSFADALNLHIKRHGDSVRHLYHAVARDDRATNHRTLMKWATGAFVSCPYDDGRRILESVDKMSHHLHAEVTAERLDVSFYNSGTTAILVRYDWHQNLFQHMVPKSLAVPLMIQEEMRAWPGAELAERWETMAPYFLGSPHGARSSLFVSQDTAMAMKKAYMALVESGMFGPLRMD